MKSLLVLLIFSALAFAQTQHYITVAPLLQQYAEFPLIVQIDRNMDCFGLWSPVSSAAQVTVENAAGTVSYTFDLEGHNCAPFGSYPDKWVCPTNQAINAAISTTDTFTITLDKTLDAACAYTNPTFTFDTASWNRAVDFTLSPTYNNYYIGQKIYVSNLGSGTTLYGPMVFSLRYASGGSLVESRVAEYFYEPVAGGTEDACYYMDYKISTTSYTLEFKGQFYYDTSAATSAFTYKECVNHTDCEETQCDGSFSDWYCNYTASYSKWYCWDKYGVNNTNCFVATAAYGTAFSSELATLRGFRDDVLADSILGRSFVRTYYKYGPKLAEVIEGSEAKRLMARIFLSPFIWTIRYPISMMLTLTVVPFTTLMLVSYLGRVFA